MKRGEQSLTFKAPSLAGTLSKVQAICTHDHIFFGKLAKGKHFISNGLSLLTLSAGSSPQQYPPCVGHMVLRRAGSLSVSSGPCTGLGRWLGS